MNSLGGQRKESAESANYFPFVSLGSWWAIIWKCLECLVPHGLGKIVRSAQRYLGGDRHMGKSKVASSTQVLHQRLLWRWSLFLPALWAVRLGGSGQGEHVMWGLGTLFAELLPKWPKEDRFTLENSFLILLLCCSLKKKDSRYIQRGKWLRKIKAVSCVPPTFRES